MTPNASDRTRVKRIPGRGSNDPETIASILDSVVICHVAFPFRGSVSVLPTGFVRIGDEIVIHGSAASAMLRAIAEGCEVAIAVTNLEGLVLARSAFHHSMNYRSVVVFGKGRVVEGDEKLTALDCFLEKVVPGRSGNVRVPTDKELLATLVVAIPTTEASAKERTGPPVDDDDDYSLPYWAGEVPVRTIIGEPIADPKLDGSIPTPEHVTRLTTRKGFP